MVLWRKDVDVALRSMWMHHINVEVKSEIHDHRAKIDWFLWMAQGSKPSFVSEILIELVSETQLSWMCIGDLLNEILFSHEMKDRGVGAEWQMHSFRDLMDVCGLQDISSSRYMFNNNK